MQKKFLSALAATISLLSFSTAFAQSNDATEPEFRALYKELVETNTTFSVGNCTVASEQIAARMKAAGFKDSELKVFVDPNHPREGGLVAEFKGSDTSKKAILLLAHIDVVEAKRSDWIRDPFTLIEEGGYFYARGTLDDKAMAAIFADSLIRYKKEGYVPKRTIKMALTCGEETSAAFNGAKFLSQEHKDWIDAEFALNEGAGGMLDSNGNKVTLNIQAGEKVYQDFKLTTTNPGGHSSQPLPDNAIYEMSAALEKISDYEFPVQFNDANRGFFTKIGNMRSDEIGKAMLSIVANPNDKAADELLSRDKAFHSMLRTTCVATMIEGGHAKNALPQHVEANVNCRIFPGTPPEEIMAKLNEIIGNEKVKIEYGGPKSIATPTPKLTPQITAPIEKLSAEIYPNIPIVPVLTTGATDAIYTNAAGIPTYGFSAIFVDPDLSNIHGLNERVRVKSLMDGRTFLYRLVKEYTK